MVDPSKKPDTPESTLVEDDDESLSDHASSSPTLQVKPIGPNAQTIPLPPAVATPVGKRPTSSALPAQRAEPPTLPTLPPEPKAPERRRTSSKRAMPAPPPEETTRPVTAWEDPPTLAPPVSSPRPPTGSLDGDTPVERVTRPPPPLASPKPPLELLDEPTPVTPISSPAAAPVRELSEPATRLNPLPQARQVVGPSGTMDTDGGPPMAPRPDPGATFTEELSADRLPARAAPTHGPDTAPSKPGERTHDFQPAHPSKGSADLDERSFQRWLIAIAAGGAALVVLAVVWVFVKFEEPPPDVGVATPLAPVEAKKPAAREPGLVPEAPRAVMIEQQVDAGDGSTRTVMAAAGTVRIVTDPDCTVFIDGKDMGMAPVLVTLPAGKNAVVLENKKLFFKRTVNVDVLPNEQTAVRFAFSQGWIELDVPKGSKVTIDGRPASGTHVQVWEGTHKVEAVHSDRRRSRSVQTVEVASGMTTSVHFEAPSNADE